MWLQPEMEGMNYANALLFTRSAANLKCLCELAPLAKASSLLLLHNWDRWRPALADPAMAMGQTATAHECRVNVIISIQSRTLAGC